MLQIIHENNDFTVILSGTFPEPFIFESSTQHVILRFVSFSDNTARGFTATFRSITSGMLSFMCNELYL